MLLRPQEMALYVEQGVIDVGLAGRDWVVDCGTDVKEIAELVYSKATNQPARWVLAVAQDSKITSVKDLEGKLKQAAKNFEFEKAALLRDEIVEIRRELSGHQ